MGYQGFAVFYALPIYIFSGLGKKDLEGWFGGTFRNDARGIFMLNSDNCDNSMSCICIIVIHIWYKYLL